MLKEKTITRARRRRSFIDGAASTVGFFPEEVHGVKSDYTYSFFVVGCAIHSAIKELSDEYELKK